MRHKAVNRRIQTDEDTPSCYGCQFITYVSSCKIEWEWLGAWNTRWGCKTVDVDFSYPNPEPFRHQLNNTYTTGSAGPEWSSGNIRASSNALVSLFGWIENTNPFRYRSSCAPYDVLGANSDHGKTSTSTELARVRKSLLYIFRQGVQA